MEDVHSFMVDWTKKFIKNKDIMTKQISDIEEKKDNFDLTVKYKDGKEQFFIIKPVIDDISSILEKISNETHLSIVVLNNKHNLDILCRNWKKLIQYKFLNIYFINPFSAIDKKWVIYPYTHHKICDEASLELGLKSMFEMVEPIMEEEIKRKNQLDH